jgi:hypothetical protein
MSRSLPLFFSLLLLMGCSRGGGSATLVAAYGPGDAAEVTPAPRDGVYALTGPDGLRAQVQVSRDVPVGFRKCEDGRLQAVAGQRPIPLPEGVYNWQLVPSASYEESKPLSERIGGRIAGTVEGPLRGPLEAVCLCIGFPVVWVMQGGPFAVLSGAFGVLFH